MKMINALHSLIDPIQQRLKKIDEWDSLVINRRKPHTYRAFTSFDSPEGVLRVCLHRFEPCDPDECFAHPHPWPGAFLMLDGEYVHSIGYSPDLDSEPTFIFEEIVRPFSAYQIVDRQTWHKVQPTKTSYTLMINGAPWDEQHAATVTTKGKDLDKFTDEELKNHLDVFDSLLKHYWSWLIGSGNDEREFK